MAEAVAVGPVAARQRVGTLDLLRGVAVCGILLMNIPLMGMIGDTGMPPLPYKANADWYAYLVQSIGFEGSMRGLFTLLFGAGMAVMMRNAPGPDGASSPAGQAYLTRCFALMLLGVAQFALFLWPGEILFNYGLCGLALLLFRRADTRLLLTAAAAMLVSLSISFGLLEMKSADKLREAEPAVAAQKAHKPLTPVMKKALEAREKIIAEAHPDPKDVVEERAERTSFPGVLKWSAGLWARFNLANFQLWSCLESLGFMLIGVALLRLKVLTGERPLSTYLWLTGTGYAVGFAVRGWQAWTQVSYGFEPNVTNLAWDGWLYEIGRLFVTLGMVGAIVLLYRVGALNWVAGGLKATGRLALTNYSLQSIVTSVLFYGFGLLGKFGFAQLMAIAALIWIVQGVFSWLWLKRWGMGPAEWLLRSLTYGRWQALGREKARTGPTAMAAE